MPEGNIISNSSIVLICQQLLSISDQNQEPCESKEGLQGPGKPAQLLNIEVSWEARGPQKAAESPLEPIQAPRGKNLETTGSIELDLNG